MLGRRAFLKLFGGSLFGLMALGGYALGYEPVVRLNVTRYALSPPGWTPGLKLRIVALADFHACEPWMTAERIASICAHANELGGDIILLLGDYTSGTNLITGRVDHRIWAAELAQLKAPLGVHAIVGNHDWWHDATAQRTGHGPTFSHRALSAVDIEVYSNRPCAWKRTGTDSGSPASRISLLCAGACAGSAPLQEDSTISTGHWRRLWMTPPSSFSRTSRISFLPYRRGCRSPCRDTRMADR